MIPIRPLPPLATPYAPGVGARAVRPLALILALALSACATPHVNSGSSGSSSSSDY